MSRYRDICFLIDVLVSLQFHFFQFRAVDSSPNLMGDNKGLARILFEKEQMELGKELVKKNELEVTHSFEYPICRFKKDSINFVVSSVKSYLCFKINFASLQANISSFSALKAEGWSYQEAFP